MANEWADSRNRHVQRAPCCSGLSERSCERILAVEFVAEMITEKSRMAREEGAPLIGFGGLGNIDALIGGY